MRKVYAIIIGIIFSFITSGVYATIFNIPDDYYNIQTGINLASNGDTVLVQPGTYFENLNYDGKSITVASLFLTTEDSSYISQTIINGQNNRCVVKFENGEDSTAILKGFTLTNGDYYYGGGIYCNNSSPTISNMIITSNLAQYGGGGISCNSNSAPKIMYTEISNNSAYDSFANGGAIYCFNSSPQIEYVTIANNSATMNGGVMYCYDHSNPLLRYAVVYGNSSNNSSVYCSNYSSPTICRTTISNNNVTNGGIINIGAHCAPQIENTIVSNNIGGYGIYCSASNSSPSITYSDFFDNEDGNFFGCSDSLGVNDTININGDSCDVFFNIQLNPLFIDPDSNNYQITSNSPCVDAGNPSSPPDPDGTIADIGAFFFGLNYFITPTALDFGNVYIGEDSTLSVLMLNISDEDITINNVYCTDSTYTTDWQTPVLPAFDSLLINVTFTPEELDSIIASLIIENSNKDTAISLCGSGLGANISADTTFLNFGAVEIGEQDTLSLTITNAGGNIDLEVINLIFDSGEYFNIISLSDTIVPPDDSSVINIEFYPQIQGLLYDSLFIISNAYSSDTIKTTLSGEGGITPASVENLSITILDSVDAKLNWNEVDTTIYGNPIDIDYYFVYYCGSLDSVFYFHGYTADTTYTHKGVAFVCDNMFYQVTAFIGELRQLDRLFQQNKIIKLGDINKFIRKQAD